MLMKFKFYIVGVGGTGSLLARDLPKLIIRSENEMCLIDGDVVESKNIIRQGYQKQDVGINKAIALSRKINSLYPVECEFMDCYLTYDNMSNLLHLKHNKKFIPVIIGCVDNDATRKILEKIMGEQERCIYIDSANSEYEGNIYVAIKSKKGLHGKLRGQSYKLEDDRHPDEISCQEHVSKGNVQYLVTNAKMAVEILEHCNALLENRLEEGVQVVDRFKTVFY